LKVFKALMMMLACLVVLSFLTIAVAGPPGIMPLQEDDSCIAYMHCDSWTCVSLALRCERELFDNDFFTPL